MICSHLPASSLFSLFALSSFAFAGTELSAKEGKAPVSLLQEDWRVKAIEPVTNPIFFEDPTIRTEIRPIFMHHEIDNTFLTRGGDVRVYALQLRYAITPRFAFIATKDGYVDFDASSGLVDHEGWADIAGGFKYAVVDDPEHELIVTPGVKFEFASGNRRVFQGNGSGEWDLFIAAKKGFGNLHLTANTGVRIPNDLSKETAQWHYSAQVDYWMCRWFIPFVAVNGFTVLRESNVIPLDTEGFDLINFGSSQTDYRTQVAVGAGFRSRLLENLDLGVAYEKAATEPHGLYGDRFTVDFVLRF